MLVKKPGFLKDAIATEKGYVSPKGELLKAAKLSPEAIAEWNGTCCQKENPIVETIEFEEVIEDASKTLDELTKAELVEYATAKDIEIAKKDTKKAILGKIKGLIS